MLCSCHDRGWRQQRPSAAVHPFMTDHWMGRMCTWLNMGSAQGGIRASSGGGDPLNDLQHLSCGKLWSRTAVKEEGLYAAVVAYPECQEVCSAASTISVEIQPCSEPDGNLPNKASRK